MALLLLLTDVAATTPKPVAATTPDPFAATAPEPVAATAPEPVAAAGAACAVPHLLVGDVPGPRLRERRDAGRYPDGAAAVPGGMTKGAQECWPTH